MKTAGCTDFVKSKSQIRYRKSYIKWQIQLAKVGIANFVNVRYIANLLVFFSNPLNANPLILNIFQYANH
jgi:hypothetical protein